MIKNQKLRRIFKDAPYYALVELSSLVEDFRFTKTIEDNFYSISYLCKEIIVSKSVNENKNLWNYREMVPIAERNIRICLKHDISVPLSNIEKFISRTEKSIQNFDKDFDVINFGHLGDNNLHYNVFSKVESKNIKLEKMSHIISNMIFESSEKLGGSFSAEHGIGQQRKKELIKFKKKEEIELMRKIKELFDPNNILNPGKVI